MADLKKKKQLEAKLTLQQRKAANLLVEKDLGDELGSYLTDEEISEQCDITRMTLYRWKTQNAAFREYINIMADEYFEARRSFVYKQLLKTISGEQPSIKGLDLYMKRFGLLTERHEVTASVHDEGSILDIESSIREVDDLLNGEEFDLIEEHKREELEGITAEELEEFLYSEKKDKEE